MNRMHIRAIAIVIGVLFIAAQAHAGGVGSHAATNFVTYTSGSGSFDGLTLGWQFDVTAAGGINVTHLGVYDASSDGLGANHDVAIFYGPGWGGLTGTVVPGASGTVLAGTGELLVGTTPNGAFRYHDIADVVLATGTYRIGGVGASPDAWQQSPTPLTFGPGLANFSPFFSSGTGPTYPTTPGGESLYSGPNFLFPEPSGAMILAVGSAALLRRRSRNVSGR